MPNWCTNKITVLEGPDDENQRYLETAKRLSFNEIITEPTEFGEDISSSGHEEDDDWADHRQFNDEKLAELDGHWTETDESRYGIDSFKELEQNNRYDSRIKYSSLPVCFDS